MVATAGSVAAGSVIGHGISNWLFGGREAPSEPAAQAPAEPELAAQSSAWASGQQHQQTQATSCERQAKGTFFVRDMRRSSVRVMRWIEDFTLCLEKADLPSCTYYLEQLKAVRVLLSCYSVTLTS